MSTAAPHRPPSLGRFRAGESRIHLVSFRFNRKEKSLPYVAIIAKFLDDNKQQKGHLKLFQTSSMNE